MDEKIGLDAYRKNKTERPPSVEPNSSEEQERSRPERLLVTENKKLTTKDLPKSIRISIATHTAISTIATIEDMKIYEVINTVVENYINDLPPQKQKLIKNSVKSVSER
ncbi:hypothetical protein [Listeria booriae]|uniref:Uncharacterized protein n=1 Tax=Listeria booriae TaxID=1552123 RepID=A0A841Y3A3_9LIST|nr:hypothetical protein [Listeria booriae]MBC1318520.1 hypothetical protein [Listeria booriae]MBC1890048.1 hypothetical protein [Listeria booriae]MBC2388829.1 hypothetical protein [Listeria booriae]